MSVLRAGSAVRLLQPQIRSTLSSFRCRQYARFLSSIAVLERRGDQLQSSCLSAITAAQKVGGPVTGVIAGSNVKVVAAAAARVKGLDKVLVIENGDYDKVGDTSLCFYVAEH